MEVDLRSLDWRVEIHNKIETSRSSCQATFQRISFTCSSLWFCSSV